MDRRSADDVRDRIDAFLASTELKTRGAKVVPLTGDASDRRYFRVLLRDDRTDQRPAVASSEAIPTSAGDAGRYHLHGEIARGGMGIVLKGRDVDLGRDVAIKVLLEAHQGQSAQRGKVEGDHRRPGGDHHGKQ